MRYNGFASISVALALQATWGAAADWPPIPQGERDLTRVEADPRAPAVVLFESGNLVIDHRGVSSYLEVYRRVKVLTEEGMDQGSVSLWASDFYRMKELEGRTHLPDGGTVELSRDAQFERSYSLYYKTNVLSFAMPQVQVGAIIEYRYRVYFDSPIYAQPWFFQSHLPVLHSEITCEFPHTYALTPIRVAPYGDEIHEQIDRGPQSSRVTYTARDLRPIPDEPSRYPFQDLAARAMFLPTERVYSGTRQPLLKNWEKVIEIFQGAYGLEGYKASRRHGASAKRVAREMTAGMKDPVEKARVLYRFVADEVATEHYVGVGVGDRFTDRVLNDRRGDLAEKALLLQTMLGGVKLSSQLGWTNPRDQGVIIQEVPNPWQFDHVLVVLELGERRLFLDPSTPHLPFGGLPPMLEDVPLLLVDGKRPEWTTTPASTADHNRSVATLELTVTPEGGITGRGTLEMIGHAAWRQSMSEGHVDDPEAGWSDWLDSRLRGFSVEDVTARWTREEQRVEWTMALRESEILGDEVSIVAAAPLGRSDNPFTLHPNRRITPVLLDHPSSERVELTVRWPDGWVLDPAPDFRNIETAAGRLVTSLQLDPAARTLQLSRRLDITAKDYPGRAEYRELHRLLRNAAVNDAQEFTLLRADE